MSLHDEQLRERQKTTIGSYIAPQEIGAVEIQSGTIPAGDIADNAITAAKIAATVAGDGIGGGAGVALFADVDNSSVAIIANKVEVKAQGVGIAHLHAGTKGTGMVQTGASAVTVWHDDVNINFTGTQLQLKDAGVGKAKLAANAKKHSVSFALPAFIGAQTVRAGLFAVPTGVSISIIKAELAAHTIPISAAGTCGVRLVNWDSSAAADDEIVAAWNAEGLVAKTGTTLVVIVAGAINVLEQNDYLYVELISDNVIGTPWLAATLTIEYQEV